MNQGRFSVILPFLTSTTNKICTEISMKLFLPISFFFCYRWLLAEVVIFANFFWDLMYQVKLVLLSACSFVRQLFTISIVLDLSHHTFFINHFFNLCYFCFYSSLENRLIFFRPHHFHFSKYSWMQGTRNLNI